MRTHSDYVPLHLHTEYSLLDGAIKISELVKRAEEYRLPALAITDHGNIFGAIEFYQKVSKAGIKPIIGVEIYVAPESRFKKQGKGTGVGPVRTTTLKSPEQDRLDNAYHLILLAKDLAGYKNLLRLVSLAHLEGFYYKPRIDNELLEQYSGGLICLSSCMKGEIPSLILKGDIDGARRRALYYKNLFGPENFYLELQANGIPEQIELNKKLFELAQDIHVGVVATNDCHYLSREDAKAHEILLCIQTNKTIHDKDRMRFQTDEFYFKSPEEIKKEFQAIPEAIKNTVLIAERCNLTLELGQVLLPEFKTPDGSSPDVYLERNALEGLRRRFAGDSSSTWNSDPDRTVTIPENYLRRLKEELQMIKRMGYSSYFLIVWDFIKYAKERGIPVGPGRGSAAGSLVAWGLGITEIDPIKYGLLFERFLNPERVSMPDIDVDFCRDRRDEVIKYVQQRYGKDQVAQIITFGTMASRAVVRDVGRVLGLPYQDVDRIAKMIPVSATKEINLKKAIELSPSLKEAYENNAQVKELLDIAMKLEGLARHASVHAAGVVIAPEPLTEYTALYRSSKGDETITTQFDLESVEKVGLIKFDFLGLDTLTIMDSAVKYIKEKDKGFDLNRIPLDDRETFKLLASGKTAGVFQLESSGMRELLIKMEPDRFDDLIALVALYRPGPLGSGMVDEFIKRKKGIVPVQYEIPALKDILDETYGVILYQEQVMQISNRIAGFSLGQADILRRAISKKDPFLMEELKNRFINGAVERGLSEEKAKKLFELIEYFGNYGFNKSHSAAYAYVAYQTAYLKAHYPVEFMAASLSAEINNTDKIVKLINECREMGIEILPPDINKSGEGFTIEGNAIRFGLMAVKGVGSGAVSAIIEERSKGEFKSFEDFLLRMSVNSDISLKRDRVSQGTIRSLNKKVMESLIKAGAFDSLGICRTEALQRLESPESRRPSVQPGMFDIPMPAPGRAQSFTGVDSYSAFELEALKLSYEKEALGFYITGHPVQPFRDILKILGIKTTEELRRLYNVDSTDTKEAEGISTVEVGAEQGVFRNGGNEPGLAAEVTVAEVAGLIIELKKHRTKGKNELMSFLTIEDEYGSLEVVVFPELYKKSQPFLEKGVLIVVKGRIDLSEKGLKIISEDIAQFDVFMRENLKRASRFSLRLNQYEIEKEKLNRFVDFLRSNCTEEHMGLPLQIELAMPDCIVTIQSRYTIAPDVRIFRKMQELLGKGTRLTFLEIQN